MEHGSSLQPKKAQHVKSNVKTMLIAFFVFDGLVHREYIPRGQMVKKEFYRTVLQRLRDAAHRHHPEKWRSGSWILHHDNAPANRAVITNEFLAKHDILSLPHPPFSPDLALCDFLFLQLGKMRGRRFDYVEEIQANATRQLRAVQKVTTRGAIVSGRKAGISAYKQKDTTSKETRPTSFLSLLIHSQKNQSRN